MFIRDFFVGGGSGFPIINVWDLPMGESDYLGGDRTPQEGMRHGLKIMIIKKSVTIYIIHAGCQ